MTVFVVQNSTGLLTTNYVLLETSALLQSRLGIGAVRAFHEDVEPLLSIEWISADRHHAGLEAVISAGKEEAEPRRLRQFSINAPDPGPNCLLLRPSFSRARLQHHSRRAVVR